MSESKIFQDALKLDSSQRQAYLEKVCGMDQMLRHDVESLLRAHDASRGPLQEDPNRQIETVDTSDMGEMIGTTIGPYRLMEQIGEGGFGLVFVAEQQHPVQRKVALKVIKPGMDSRDVVARFEAERQALALMEHPNIARVFDGGMTQGGRPYFVMELVKGLPITEYCDQAELDARERLKLFISICRAVQHAHAKGVIHRDLKPSNILVAPHDGIPVVKVIDFGVAKAIGQRLTNKTLYTRFHQMIGTPLYMSPEQAEVNALDVDTRSDVYSLGVLLYELLTSTTPFDRQRFATAAFDEIRRVIREEDPPKPSTRLSTMGATLASVSARRKSDPMQLQTLVKGELDWIVMKALEKERTRRYETVERLAKDVERYLADERVEACPPTLRYRFHKAYRKNRTVILTASTFATVLLVASAVSITSAVRTKAALNRERAAISELQVAQQQLEEKRALAEQKQEEAEAFSEFLFQDILAAADPGEEANRDITLKAVLDRAVQKLDDQFVEPSLVSAAIQLRLGKIYANLNERFIPQRLLSSSYQTRRDLLGEDHPDTLLALESLIATTSPWQSEFATQARLLYDLRRKTLGESDVATLRSLQYVLSSETHGEPAGPLKTLELRFQDLVRAQTVILGDAHTDVLASLQAQAGMYERHQRWEEALQLRRQCLTRCRRSRPDNHPETLRVMRDLIQLYSLIERYDEALKLLPEAEQIAASVFGPDNSISDRLSEQRFAILVKQEDLAGEVAQLEREMEAGGDLAGNAEKRLGILYAWMNDREAHTEFCRLVLRKYARTMDPRADRVTRAFLLLPVQDQQLFEEAMVQVRRCRGLVDAGEFVGNPNWVECISGMAEYRRGNFEAAKLCFNRVLPEGNPSSRDVQTARIFLAMTESQLGNADRATQLLSEVGDVESGGLLHRDPENVLVVKCAFREAMQLLESHSHQ